MLTSDQDHEKRFLIYCISIMVAYDPSSVNIRLVTSIPTFLLSKKMQRKESPVCFKRRIIASPRLSLLLRLEDAVCPSTLLLALDKSLGKVS